MLSLFLRTYFKRIIKFALFLQIIVSISFSFFQTPHFLSIFKGLEFDIFSVITMILLRTLEWVNFITLSSFVGSFLVIIGNDLRKNYIESFLLQMGRNLEYLIRPIFFISFVGCFFMIGIDGFCVPYGNFFLKKELLALSKDRIVANIKPGHVISLGGWNFCVGKRIDDMRLDGVLFNKEGESSITVFINQAKFKNKEYMNLDLKQGIGKVEIGDESLLFTFEEGVFNAPSSAIIVEKTKRNLNLFQLTNINDIIHRLKMSFVMLVLPFWVFLMLCGATRNLMLGSVAFTLVLFMAIDIVPFNVFVFFGASIFLYFIYRNNKKKVRVR